MGKILLPLILLYALIFNSLALAQSISIDLDLRDLQEIDRCFQEREVLRTLNVEQAGQIVELKKSLTTAQEERDLEKRDRIVTEKMNAVLQREVEGTMRNFDQMKEVADRAIKLAETSSKASTPNWLYLIPIIGLAIALGAAL